MVNNSTYSLILFLALCFIVQCSSNNADAALNVQSNSTVKLFIKPSLTDENIITADVDHLVMYDTLQRNPQLLLFLPGTNGIPQKGPIKLFETAIQMGYKVINLSYINTPSVASVCRDQNLLEDSECTTKFRTQRVFGDQLISFIPDQSYDAIINRFTHLLQYLKENDKNGEWEQFIENDRPKWNIISLAGQSQGGGMSAFIAKKIEVKRVITFSGGWDYAGVDKIANWYYSDSITPANRWYGVYHSKEPKAKTIEKTYKAMNIPKEHIFALNREIRKGKKAHGEGIRNTKYKDLWITLLTD